MAEVFCCQKVRRVAAWQVIFTAALALLLVTTDLRAGSGNIASVPPPGSKVKNGLRLEVDTRGVDANGYRPVRITASVWPPGPAPAERTLRIVAYVNRYGDLSGYSQQASDYLEIAAGAKDGTVALLIPQTEIWQTLQIDVFEDGELLSDLSRRNLGTLRNNWNFADNGPAILCIDKDVPLPADRAAAITKYKTTGNQGTATYELPDFRPLAEVLPRNSYNNPPTGNNVYQALDDIRLLDLAGEYSTLELAGLTELPNQWLELSCYDLIIVSYDDLKLLDQQHPAAMQALREWLSTGPLLCVSGVGEKFEHLAKVEQLLQLPRLSPDQKHPEFAGWKPPQDDTIQGQVVLPEVNSNFAWQQTLQQAQRINGTQNSSKSKSFAKDPPFLLRPAGLGRLVAIPVELSGDKPATVDWTLILNATGSTHWRWISRNGIADSSNPWYWEFLIPGVGMAPVISFVVLITLFMLLIGPVNYWFVRRLQRTYLLLITVPAGAAVVTLGLFLYALATEGLRVNARVRSLTMLDSEHGRATTVSRHSYYASLTPSAGLQFPHKAAVFVLDPSDREYNNKMRTLLWEEEGQRLKSGYLFPRTVAQFMAVEPTASTSRLIVTGPAGSATGRSAKNELGSRIEQLVIRDAGGLVLGAQKIEAGQTVPLTVPAKDWAEAFRENEPKQLVDFNPTTSQNLFMFMFNGPFYYGNSATTDPKLSLLESSISSVADLTKIGELPPGKFVAIVHEPAEVALGIAGSRRVACFHVMVGDWQP